MGDFFSWLSELLGTAFFGSFLVIGKSNVFLLWGRGGAISAVWKLGFSAEMTLGDLILTPEMSELKTTPFFTLLNPLAWLPPEDRFDTLGSTFNSFFWEMTLERAGKTGSGSEIFRKETITSALISNLSSTAFSGGTTAGLSFDILAFMGSN